MPLSGPSSTQAVSTGESNQSGSQSLCRPRRTSKVVRPLTSSSSPDLAVQAQPCLAYLEKQRNLVPGPIRGDTASPPGPEPDDGRLGHVDEPVSVVAG
jgi:hypothetical protein